MAAPKGVAQNPNGKKKGTMNKATRDFKEALNAMLQNNAENIAEWLQEVAMEDPARALDQLGKFAEFVYPKLARTTMVGEAENPLRTQQEISQEDKEILNKFLEAKGVKI